MNTYPFLTAALFAAGLFLCAASCTAEQITAEQMPAPLTQEQLETIAVQPPVIQKETGNRVVPAMLPLFRELSVDYCGKKYKYRLHTPEKMEEGKKYPLILWLHGVGEIGSDNQLQLVHLHHIITYLTGEKKQDFFLLVPQQPKDMQGWNSGGSYKGMSYIPVPRNNLSPEELEKEKKKQLDDFTKQITQAYGDLENKDGENKTVVEVKDAKIEYMTEEELQNLKSSAHSEETKKYFERGTFWKLVYKIKRTSKENALDIAFAALDKTAADFPVDADRITVSGLSSGGDGTWRALEARPDTFAAGIPLVSWTALQDEELEKSPVLKKIPIWAIYSSDDNSIDTSRMEFERAEKAGCNVMKTEFGICGHSAWTPAMLQADIFSWLLSRGKKDGKYIAVADSKTNPDAMKGIIDVESGKPTLAPAVKAAVTAASPAKPDAAPDTLSDASVKTEKKPQQTEVKTEKYRICRLFIKLFIKRKKEPVQQAAVNPPQTDAEQPKAADTPEFKDTAAGEEITVKGKVIEDCDKPWAMTSDSLYGLFAADWTKEAKELPDFIVKSDSDQLAKMLAKSLGGDAKDFEAACKSVLGLPDNPMSSPWFETSGGRLAGEIKYKLSAKGEMFVRLLKTVKDSVKNSDKAAYLAKFAEKTLEKIDSITEAK